MLFVASGDIHPLADFGTRNFMKGIYWTSTYVVSCLVETFLILTSVPTRLIQDATFMLETTLS